MEKLKTQMGKNGLKILLLFCIFILLPAYFFLPATMFFRWDTIVSVESNNDIDRITNDTFRSYVEQFPAVDVGTKIYAARQEFGEWPELNEDQVDQFTEFHRVQTGTDVQTPRTFYRLPSVDCDCVALIYLNKEYDDISKEIITSGVLTTYSFDGKIIDDQLVLLHKRYDKDSIDRSGPFPFERTRTEILDNNRVHEYRQAGLPTDEGGVAFSEWGLWSQFSIDEKGSITETVEKITRQE